MTAHAPVSWPMALMARAYDSRSSAGIVCVMRHPLRPVHERDVNQKLPGCGAGFGTEIFNNAVQHLPAGGRVEHAPLAPVEIRITGPAGGLERDLVRTPLLAVDQRAAQRESRVPRLAHLAAPLQAGLGPRPRRR